LRLQKYLASCGVASRRRAEELIRRLDGVATPKELHIAFNGGGMACYGAAREDIGIIFRRGAFELYIGGKGVGRNPYPARLVEEGLSAEELIERVITLVEEYRQKGHSGERFCRYLERLEPKNDAKLLSQGCSA